LNVISEGAYGVVYRARDRQSDSIYAIKKVKLEPQHEKEGFPISALRELNTLINMKHPNLINVKEVVFGSTLKKVFVVMEYCEHELKSILEDRKLLFSHAQVKNLVWQLLRATEHMHSNFVMHRDLKTSNLLYSNTGLLKVCDFGLARTFTRQKPQQYTNWVVTMWYRSPELLLGADVYNEKIDMWSIACIFAELILREPLFCGKNEMDQLDKIFAVLGNPTEETWPGFTKLKLVDKVAFNNKNTQSKLRDKIPARPCGPTDSMYLTNSGIDLLEKLFCLNPD
jgi:cell division cycle 2-like